MATGKIQKENKRTTDISFRSSVRNPVVPMANDNDSNEQHVPWSLLIAVVVLCLVFVIVLPVVGLMYMDMNNATNAAIQEVERVRRIRNLMLKELENLRDINKGSIVPNDQGQ